MLINSLLMLSCYATTALSSPVKPHARQLRDTIVHSRPAQSCDPYGYTTVRTIPLRRSPHDLQHSSKALRKRATHLSESNDIYNAGPSKAGSTFLRTTGASFLAEISFGSRSFLSVVDTGSSDTWIVHSDFTCVDIVTNQIIPRVNATSGRNTSPAVNSKRYRMRTSTSHTAMAST